MKAVFWPDALRWLVEEKANGTGTTSTFRGVVHNEKIEIFDAETALADGTPAGTFIVQWLKEHGATRRPAANENRFFVAPPRFARPGAWHDCFYIDIKAAYPSIYSRVAWDVNFMPQSFIVENGKISLAGLAASLKENKHARNAVVGIALSRHKTRWEDGRPRRVGALGGLFNPQLGWYCWAVLSWCALVAEKLGAHYYNTDGAIFSSADAALEYADFLERSGFDWSVKENGDCVVWGLNSYSFIKDGVPGGFPKPFSQEKRFVTDPIIAKMVFEHFTRLERVL